MSLQPTFGRNGSGGLGLRKGGLLCFLWPENPGQATVLDVSVNFNWLTEQWDSLEIVHKPDSSACNADSCCCWSVTDGEKWFSRHPKPPCPSTVHPGMKGRFASADSEHVYMFVMTRLNVVFEKCAEKQSLCRTSVSKPFEGGIHPGCTFASSKSNTD